MRVLVITSTIALALAASACDQETPVATNDGMTAAPADGYGTNPVTPAAEPAMTGGAAEFVEAAARSNMLEIETSRLALERTQNAQVREFAEMMIADHTAATEQLQEIAQGAGMTVPTTFTDMGPLESLRAEDADGFEDAYLDAQVDMHEQTIERFETYATSGDNPQLRDMANTLLPTLRMHLERAPKRSEAPSTRVNLRGEEAGRAPGLFFLDRKGSALRQRGL